MNYRRQGRLVILNPFRSFLEVGKSIFQIVIVGNKNMVVLG